MYGEAVSDGKRFDESDLNPSTSPGNTGYSSTMSFYSEIGAGATDEFEEKKTAEHDKMKTNEIAAFTDF